jgi:hypothetical protein
MIVIHDCLVFTAANTGGGPMMFAGISSLLKLLKKSFQNETERGKNEQQFQTAVINGIGKRQFFIYLYIQISIQEILRKDYLIFKW